MTQVNLEWSQVWICTVNYSEFLSLGFLVMIFFHSTHAMQYSENCYVKTILRRRYRDTHDFVELLAKYCCGTSILSPVVQRDSGRGRWRMHSPGAPIISHSGWPTRLWRTPKGLMLRPHSPFHKDRPDKTPFLGLLNQSCLFNNRVMSSCLRKTKQKKVLQGLYYQTKMNVNSYQILTFFDFL